MEYISLPGVVLVGCNINSSLSTAWEHKIGVGYYRGAILARAVGVPVCGRSSGRLATTLVAISSPYYNIRILNKLINNKMVGGLDEI